MFRRSGIGASGFAKRLDRSKSQALKAAAAVLHGSAAQIIRDEGRVDTGAMMGGFGIEEKGSEVVLYNAQEYAIYHEYGTGVWAEDGKGRETPWVYFNEKLQQYVETDGMEAIAFMRNGSDSSRRDMRDAAIDALRRGWTQ